MTHRATLFAVSEYNTLKTARDRFGLRLRHGVDYDPAVGRLPLPPEEG